MVDSFNFAAHLPTLLVASLFLTISFKGWDKGTCWRFDPGRTLDQ
jgi:hypothetical protein